MTMHDWRHESNEIGSASDAESSRVDARQSDVVGDASNEWLWYMYNKAAAAVAAAAEAGCSGRHQMMIESVPPPQKKARHEGGSK